MAKFQTEEPFEAFHTKGNRYSRDHTKLDKATQSKLDNLTDQNERLSRTNLMLSNFARRALHLLPNHLKTEYDRMMEAIKNGNFDENDASRGGVHP